MRRVFGPCLRRDGKFKEGIINGSTHNEPDDNEQSPWQKLKGELIGGTAFIVFGLIMATVGAPSVLTCERLAGQEPACELQWPVVFSMVPIRSEQLNNLRGVESVRLESPEYERGEVIYYRVMLQSADGEVTMNPGAGEKLVRQAERDIQEYLADPKAVSLEAHVPRAGGYAWLGRIGDVLMLFGLSYGLAIPFRVVQILSGVSKRES